MAARTKTTNISTSHAILTPSVNRASEGARSSKNIATFLRCLRLLDLDLKEDWPGLTEQTLSVTVAGQNLQQRVKGIEWSLYRLFELYDPQETRNRLRPFFPPLTPLQSLNLRAALFRALSDLKKNGVLGKETTLRKTMLDECKGDKFEEVISAFGAIVLHKIVSGKPTMARSLSSRVTLDEHQLFLLVMAHRSSLRSTLQKKEAIRCRAGQYADIMDQQEHDLQQRKCALESLPQVPSSSQLVDEEAFRDAWIGDERWADIILQGPPSKTNSMFKQDFEIDSKTKASEFGDQASTTQPSLVDELATRTTKLEAQLKRWRAFHLSLEKLSQPMRDEAEKSHESPPLTSAPLHFTQHQSMHLDSTSSISPSTIMVLPEHRLILDSMKEDLRVAPVRARGQGTVTMQPDLSSSTHGKKSAGRLSEGSVAQESYSSTTVDIPITKLPHSPYQPHKSSHIDRPSLAQQPPERAKITGTLIKEIEPVKNIGSAEAGPKKDVKNEKVPMAPPDRFSRGDGPVMLTPPQTQPLASTLIERTQGSMSTVRARADTTGSPLRAIQHTSILEVPSPVAETPRTEQGCTLLERTRQSMVVLPLNSRQSSIKPPQPTPPFPVNPFQTPKDKKNLSDDTSCRSGSSTPRDKLFDEEAEYASVFKSRPKIAVSPTLSPYRVD